MKRIDDKTVELTHREMVAKGFHSDLLDIGLDIPTATEAVERFGRRTTRYSEEFLLYLNDGLPLGYKV